MTSLTLSEAADRICGQIRQRVWNRAGGQVATPLFNETMAAIRAMVCAVRSEGQAASTAKRLRVVCEGIFAEHGIGPSASEAESYYRILFFPLNHVSDFTPQPERQLVSA